ncbi:MAG: cyclic pyranopterin monophosphate synthase MoaC [Chloroflexi bacterium]|nr:cyclic pyranopterin monophosphate synthase MoaC [Chloroflexota bacterium]
MTLSHVDEQGRAQMVDVSAKPDTERVAVAKGQVTMRPATLALIQSGGIEKGDVFSVARVAGIMAAKRTHELIPMCHPLLITDVAVDFEILSSGDEHEPARVGITGTAKNVGKTGVEMEALVAVATAALTIYDMAKAVDRGMHIENVRLVLKRGGKSGETRLE